VNHEETDVLRAFWAFALSTIIFFDIATVSAGSMVQTLRERGVGNGLNRSSS
jgi:signal peptidase I